MEETKQTTSTNDEEKASGVIEDCMQNYAAYSLREVFPNSVDGLKLVHRRILYIMANTDKDVKMFNIVGQVMQKHPHGDRSIADAMHKLMQPFVNQEPLLTSDGNVGTYAGDRPGAPRYLDIRRSQFMYDVYFKNTPNKVLDMVRDEMETGFEPRYLIPKIPMALITSPFSLAVGFTSFTLPYDIVSVCRMARKTASACGNTEFLQSSPGLVMPDSHVPGYMRSDRAITKSVRDHKRMTCGVTYDGTMTVGAKTITIRTLPMNVMADTLFEKLYNAVRDRNDKFSQYVSSVDDASQDLLYITLVLKRGVDPFKALDYIKSRIKFSMSVYPRMSYVSIEGKRLEYDIPQVLHDWYMARYRSILSGFKHRQTSLIQEVRKCEARVIVADNVDEVINILRRQKSHPGAIAALMKKYNLSEFQSGHLVSMPLRQLQSEARSEIIKEMNGYKKQLKTLKHQFASINKYIIAGVDEIEKKYSKPRNAVLSEDFLGAVKTPTGVIQYLSLEERHEILLDFGSENCSIVPYSKRCYKYSAIGKTITPEGDIRFPKEFRSDQFFITPEKPTHTVFHGNGKILRIKEISITPPEDGMFPVFIKEPLVGVIDRQWKYRIVRMTDIPSKQYIPYDTEFKSVFPYTDDTLIFACADSRDRGLIVRIFPVSPGGSIGTGYRNGTKIVDVFPIDRLNVINIPRNLFRKQTLRFLEIEPEKIIQSGGIKVDIRPSGNKQITKDSHGMHRLR